MDQFANDSVRDFRSSAKRGAQQADASKWYSSQTNGAGGFKRGRGAKAKIDPTIDPVFEETLHQANDAYDANFEQLDKDVGDMFNDTLNWLEAHIATWNDYNVGAVTPMADGEGFTVQRADGEYGAVSAEITRNQIVVTGEPDHDMMHGLMNELKGWETIHLHGDENFKFQSYVYATAYGLKIEGDYKVPPGEEVFFAGEVKRVEAARAASEAAEAAKKQDAAPVANAFIKGPVAPAQPEPQEPETAPEAAKEQAVETGQDTVAQQQAAEQQAESKQAQAEQTKPAASVRPAPRTHQRDAVKDFITTVGEERQKAARKIVGDLQKTETYDAFLARQLQTDSAELRAEYRTSIADAARAKLAEVITYAKYMTANTATKKGAAAKKVSASRPTEKPTARVAGVRKDLN